jgi:hypothetical protein
VRVEGPAVAFCAFPSAAKMSCRSSGRSTPRCRFPHIRRTTSSPAFPLALEWSGSMDIARLALGAPRHRPAGGLGAEETGVVPRAQATPDSAAVVHKHRKSWSGRLPLHHSAGKRQAKTQSRYSPQCKSIVERLDFSPPFPNYIPTPGVSPQSNSSTSCVLSMCVAGSCRAKICYPSPRRSV